MYVMVMGLVLMEFSDVNHSIWWEFSLRSTVEFGHVSVILLMPAL